MKDPRTRELAVEAVEGRAGRRMGPKSLFILACLSGSIDLESARVICSQRTEDLVLDDEAARERNPEERTQ
jgi:hypothetical protein